MFQATMSNSTLSEEATHHLSNTSFNNPLLLQNTSNNNNNNILSSPPPPKKVKKKRNLPGNPDPDAEVIALSPKSLLATNRFICEICNKGFQRDQNLQLHRRGHNLPWKLKQRNKLEVVRKKAYVCPEPSCVHHHPSRALGDLTGIKKHFCRKHGEKKFKCEKCSKIYAVHSDWKAHSKTCGTREYRCECGTLFSRKDSFITHRAFCDALAEESARLSTNPFSNPLLPPPQSQPNSAPPPPFPTLSTSQQNPNNPLYPFPSLTSSISLSSSPWDPQHQNPNHNNLIQVKTEMHQFSPPPPFFHQPPHLFSKGMLTSPFTSDTNTITAHFLSATALLQKASTVGTSIQQSQQSQQAQAMLMNGFDELGASFRHVGGPTTANADMSMSTMLPPQSPSSTTTTTTTTTTTNNNTHHHHQNNNTTTMGMGMGMGMRMTPESFATWRKNEDITRDFLGLTAGEQYSQSNGGGGGRRSNAEGGFEDEDDMVGNMLKFTGGLQYGMTAPYDRDNSSPTSPSPSSSSVLLKPHHSQSLVHHHQQLHDHQQGSFGNFVSSEPPTAATASDSRWG